MDSAYERKESSGGLTLKVFRGEGAGLLAFDLARADATDDFVGFTVEVKYPGSSDWGVLHNRLHFEYPPSPNRPSAYSSREAPFQKFRWIHVPSSVREGEFRYRVTARYMNGDGSLVSGRSVENSISLAPETIEGFVNVGFTRGFASSQAYADRFHNETGILPPPAGPDRDNLSHDMSPFRKHYEWLGFEARKLILDTIEEVRNNDELSLDALIYESKEPDILARLEGIGSRLRAIIDDHGSDANGAPDSSETISAERLSLIGAQVKRMHFGRQQHHKVLLVRRNGVPSRCWLAQRTSRCADSIYRRTTRFSLPITRPRRCLAICSMLTGRHPAASANIR